MNYNTIVGKKLMAIAGLIWFSYIIFHALSLLSFHTNKQIFNNFYIWFNNSSIYWLLLILLFLSLFFHLNIAIIRQLKNNIAAGIKCQRPYPQAIPRFIAWSGAFSLLFFIIFHFVQIKLFVTNDLYQQILYIFTQPIMVVIYTIGLIALGAHLHHALTNVLQTLGISSKQYNILAITIVILLLLSFISIPVSIIYA